MTRGSPTYFADGCIVGDRNEGCCVCHLAILRIGRIYLQIDKKIQTHICGQLSRHPLLPPPTPHFNPPFLLFATSLIGGRSPGCNQCQRCKFSSYLNKIFTAGWQEMHFQFICSYWITRKWLAGQEPRLCLKAIEEKGGKQKREKHTV